MESKTICLPFPSRDPKLDCLAALTNYNESLSSFRSIDCILKIENRMHTLLFTSQIHLIMQENKYGKFLQLNSGYRKNGKSQAAQLHKGYRGAVVPRHPCCQDAQEVSSTEGAVKEELKKGWVPSSAKPAQAKAETKTKKKGSRKG